jgi:hypothetical protein
VLDPALNIDEDLPRISLIPAPVQVLGRNTKLDYEIARKILRVDFAPLLPPQPDEGRFIIAHNDAGIRTAYEVTAEFLGVR